MQANELSFSGMEEAFAFDGRPWVAAKPGAKVDRVRCVLLHEQHYLLAQHYTWRLENRDKWGLIGGRLKRGEEPATALRRELFEALRLEARQLVELGDWVCRGETYRVFGCALATPIRYVDRNEIRAIGWFTHADVIQLAQSRALHKGFETRAIAACRARFAI